MSKFIGFDKDNLEEIFFRCNCLCTIGNFSYFINEDDKECWIYLNIYSPDVRITSSYVFNPKDLLELMTALAKYRALPDCSAHFSSFRAKLEY